MIVVQLASRKVESARTFALPAKRYYTLREVCHAFRLPSTTLRHWERSIPEIRAQRRGGRLFFQCEQIDLLAKFKLLVFEGGMTLEGARKQLSVRKQGARQAQIADQLMALRLEVLTLIDWIDERSVAAGPSAPKSSAL